jgi:hypothetical protein
LRRANDRVRQALVNGELVGDRRGVTFWVMRNDFDEWLERALAEDRRDEASYYKVDEARALAREAGVKGASDRILTAATGGEIEDCFKENGVLYIGKAAFDRWLEFVRSEPQELDDGCVTISEAASLAAMHGIKGSRPYIVAACVGGELPGAHRSGSTWKIPLAAIQAYIGFVCAEVERQRLAALPPVMPWYMREWFARLLLWLFCILGAWWCTVHRP